MSENLFSKFIGFLLLVGAILIAGYVYYLKFPDFHKWVDAKLPALKEKSAHFFSDVTYAPPGAATPANSPVEAPSLVNSTPAPSIAAVSASAPSSSTAQPSTNGIDIAQLSQSRSLWPKTLVLRKEVEFPAVLDGKIVGSIKAPIGSRVDLVMIKDGKLGVEYQGGGTLVYPEETNLNELVPNNHQASSK